MEKSNEISHGNRKQEKDESTIDDLTTLFKKTEAYPPIFYLPLSKEKIEAMKKSK